MTVKLYNSLTRQKEEFAPLHPPRVNFYVCGPTVYGEIHVGNARTFVMSDVMRRWLLHRGFYVVFSMNITDVDDKIINRAAAEGATPEEIARRYTEYFFAKLSALGVLPATHYPRATQHIAAMIAMIKKLIEKGNAYASEDGSVWFEVGTFPEYGKLSRMPLDQIQQGERVDPEQQRLKRSPLDFALWKAAKPGEPSWKSPWGEGRPGWHIECSCMSIKTLDAETLDIHAGGSDLRFPHHENEIAQSECATGKPFARYWIHGGMLDVEGAKMSKSLGNMKSLDDVLKVIDPLTLRYFFMSARYRDKSDYTEDSLHKCRSAVDRMLNAVEDARRLLHHASVDVRWGDDSDLRALWDEFADGMDDDLNTPKALGAMAQVVTALNTARSEAQAGRGMVRMARALALLDQMRNVLGLAAALERRVVSFDEATISRLRAALHETGTHTADDVTAEQIIAELISRRAQAKKDKNFALADSIRTRLQDCGIALEDKPGETIWKRS